MRKKTINQAQAYLTVTDETRKKKIIDIRKLLKRHTKDEVLSFMELFYKEEQGRLQALITKDKTAKEINDTVAALFRLRMAISVMKEAA
jgi:hypothetical protein